MRVSNYCLVFVSLGVLLFSGCSSDDKSTDPGGGGSTGVGGQFVTALNDVNQDYFAGNSATFNSLEYFEPYITGLVSPSSRPEGSRLAASSNACFPNLVPSTTYIFDGVSYVSSERTGAGPTAVRFVLYAVDAQGNLDLGTEIGYFELTCSDSPSLIITGAVVMSGNPDYTVLQFTLSGAVGSYTMSGTIRSAGTGAPLDLTVYKYSYTYERSLTVNMEAPGLVIGYGMRDIMEIGNPDLVDSTFVGWGVFKQDISDLTEWGVSAYLYMSPSHVITAGELIYQDQYGVGRLVGCFSGNLEFPILQPATVVQCEGIAGGWELGQMSQQDLNTILVGFMALTEVYYTVGRLFEVGTTVGGV